MKIFACSDIHSFYFAFKDALDKAGFEQNNPDHLLIVCGDCWDRSYAPQKVLEFLNATSNKILIKGNHEVMLLQMLDRGYPERHDYHNGTAETAVILEDYVISQVENKGKKLSHVYNYDLIKPLVEEFVSQMVLYYETEHYIFVHSWIPYSNILKMSGVSREYNPDWRNASLYNWEEEAMWINPFAMSKDGLNQTGKILVHGHWHNSTYWAAAEHRSEFGADAKFDIAHHNNCIGLDACTAHTGMVNVLVLEDNLI